MNHPATESVSVRRLLALLLLPLLLIVTACSQEASSPGASDASTSSSVAIPPANAEVLASVKAVDQGKDKAPKVTFDKPLDIKAESMRVVTDGTGAQVKTGQTMEFRGINLDTKTGATLVENFSAATGETVQLNDVMKTQFPLVYSTFTNAKVGAYVAYANPAVAAVTGSTAAPAQDAQPATLSVFQITSAKDAPAVVKPLAKPEGDTVTPPAGLPTVKENAKGTPVITVGDAKAPTELIAQDLIKGKGAALKESDTIVANYVGVNFVGGEIFDSSFDSATPATFPLTGVIQGWTKGLTGKTVGSRVLLVIPKAMAYGDKGSGKAKGDLVFVVDILGVQ